jgi:hypothetical protein
MNAAILNNRNEVIFSADVAEGVREIEVAGAIDINGYPVNRKTYRVSRSQRNLAKAVREESLIERAHGDLVFYTA